MRQCTDRYGGFTAGAGHTRRGFHSAQSPQQAMQRPASRCASSGRTLHNAPKLLLETGQQDICHFGLCIGPARVTHGSQLGRALCRAMVQRLSQPSKMAAHAQDLMRRLISVQKTQAVSTCTQQHEKGQLTQGAASLGVVPRADLLLPPLPVCKPVALLLLQEVRLLRRLGQQELRQQTSVLRL